MPDTVAGGADPRRSPLVAFLRFQRAAPSTCSGKLRIPKKRVPGRSQSSPYLAPPGLFHPGSAPELPPSGFCVCLERRPRLRGRSSRAVDAWALRPLDPVVSRPSDPAWTLRPRLAPGFGGLVPPGNGGRPTGVGRPLTLLALSPLRHSLPPPWAPASRHPPLACLTARAGAGAPQAGASLALQRSSHRLLFAPATQPAAGTTESPRTADPVARAQVR